MGFWLEGLGIGWFAGLDFKVKVRAYRFCIRAVPNKLVASYYTFRASGGNTEKCVQWLLYPLEWQLV